jgi:hypothetical protein
VIFTCSGDATLATKVLSAIIEEFAPDYYKIIPLLSQVKSHTSGENASQTYINLCKGMAFRFLFCSI